MNFVGNRAIIGNMNAKTMRIIDHYAGNIVCFILSKFDQIIKIFRKPKGPVKEILVMKYFGLGSILLSAPMFRALRQNPPLSKAKITFLTFYNNCEICQRLHFADNYLFIRKDNLRNFIGDLIKVLFEFRKHRFDIAIDMEFFSKFSAIITYLSFARKRVGFYVRNEPRTILYTHPISFNYYKHVTEVFLALAREVGADTIDMSLSKIKIYNVEKDFVGQLVYDHKIEKTKKIIVNVNVGEMCLERRWPKDYFARLINSLAKYSELSFIFIGSEEDYDYIQSIIDLLDRKEKIINLVGKASLGQLLTLFEASDLFITSDSGPLHLAELTSIKTISFFGPETPVLYGPQKPNHFVFYKGLYCSPCLNVYNVKTAMYGNKRCFEGHNRCMYSITVEEVLEKAKELLGLR